MGGMNGKSLMKQDGMRHVCMEQDMIWYSKVGHGSNLVVWLGTSQKITKIEISQFIDIREVRAEKTGMVRT